MWTDDDRLGAEPIKDGRRRRRRDIMSPAPHQSILLMIFRARLPVILVFTSNLISTFRQEI